MTYLILTPVSADGDIDRPEDYDFAVADLGVVRKLAKALRRSVMSIKTKVRSLKSLEFWDSSFVVISRGDAIKIFGDDVIAKIDDTSEPTIVETVSLRMNEAEQAAQRTECDILHIYDDGLYWSFYPKHVTINCETPEIPLSMLK